MATTTATICDGCGKGYSTEDDASALLIVQKPGIGQVHLDFCSDDCLTHVTAATLKGALDDLPRRDTDVVSDGN